MSKGLRTFLYVCLAAGAASTVWALGHRDWRAVAFLVLAMVIIRGGMYALDRKGAGVDGE